MPLMVDLRGAVLSGTAQQLAAVEPDGAFVGEVILKNASGAQAVTNLTAFEAPYVGGPEIQVGDPVASIAAGGVGAIAVRRNVQKLRIVATQGAGGNTVDLAVTGRPADD